jgi:hypothetical protein
MKLTLAVPTASRNIYEQHYQMGKFISKYYNNSTIALNDIGTCNYFADVGCVDFWGLGDIDISRARRSGYFNEQYIREVCEINGVNIAIVYDTWFEENGKVILPGEWVKVGNWEINDNVITGGDVVSFYAVNEVKKLKLTYTLKQFSDELPKTVIQSGEYLK